MRKSVRTVSGCRGDGGSPGNSGTNLRSDHADTDRRTHCHRDASANPHSASDRYANTVSNSDPDPNAHSRADAPVSAGYASGTHGQHLVVLEL